MLPHDALHNVRWALFFELLIKYNHGLFFITVSGWLVTDYQQHDSVIHQRPGDPHPLCFCLPSPHLGRGQSLQDFEDQKSHSMSINEKYLSWALASSCPSKGNANMSSGREWPWFKQCQVLGFPSGVSSLLRSIPGHLGWEMETPLHQNNLGQFFLQLLLLDLFCPMLWHAIPGV